MPDYIKFPAVLLVVCLASAISLAGLHKATLSQKKAIEKCIQSESLKVVMPKATSFREEKKETESYFAALDGSGNVVGYVAQGEFYGYSSTISVMVGVDSDLVVQGVKVLFQKETPGLGDKIEEIRSSKTWVKKIEGHNPDETGLRPWFQRQFENGKAPFKVKKDGGEIEAVTGATVSSRAVCNAVNIAVEKLRKVISVQ